MNDIILEYDTEQQRDDAILVLRTALERHIDRLEGEIDLNGVEYKTCDKQEAILYLNDAMCMIDNFYGGEYEL